MRVYHGSYLKINRIDLSKCSSYKDFGRGFFYLCHFHTPCRQKYGTVQTAVGGNLYDAEKGIENNEIERTMRLKQLTYKLFAHFFGTVFQNLRYLLELPRKEGLERIIEMEIIKN
jgi:hypothetical protein